jgi:histidine ammonia-lyase
LAAAVALLRAQVAHLEDDRHIQPDMQAAIGMVQSGALLQTCTGIGLPGLR